MAKSMSRSDLVSTKIDRLIDTQRKVTSTSGKILSKVARLAVSAFGSVARFFVLDFSSLWDTIVNAYFVIKDFDWNASDKEIEKMIEANNQAIATRAAASLGEQLGFGVVRLANFFLGKAAQAASSIKVPVLSARIGLALAEEQNDEAMAAVRSFLGAASVALVSNQFLSSILYLRRNELFGQKSITNDDLPNGSISEKIEQKTEKLPEFWREPARAFIDGFEDGIISAGYVVATEIDDVVAALRFSQNDRGPMRKIELIPDPENPEEVLEIDAPQGAMTEVIPQVLTTYKQIRDKDIGQFLGEPITGGERAKPSGRFLQITFSSASRPPFWSKKAGAKTKIASITIPDAKPSISWADLQSIPEFTSGEYHCHAKLDNGRMVAVWAASEGQGRRFLEDMVGRFSKASIVQGSFRASKGSENLPSKPMTAFQAAILDKSGKASRAARKEGQARGNYRRVRIWGKNQPQDFEPL